jgi:mono/diheme cytochrome c family protein
MRSGARGIAHVVAIVMVSAGCAHPKGTARVGTPSDSTFAAVAGERNRSPEQIARDFGSRLYGHYCAICHGETGGGDGFNAYNVKAAFGVDPTAFADSATFVTLHADSAMRAIGDGGPAIGASPAMPPWGRTLTRVEMSEVWLYIRSLHQADRQEE